MMPMWYSIAANMASEAMLHSSPRCSGHVTMLMPPFGTRLSSTDTSRLGYSMPSTKPSPAPLGLNPAGKYGHRFGPLKLIVQLKLSAPS